jgi:hypothetical protein
MKERIYGAGIALTVIDINEYLRCHIACIPDVCECET